MDSTKGGVMDKIYCTECRVAHGVGMLVKVELCTRHAAAGDLLLALARIRSKAGACIESGGKFAVQTLDSIDEIAEHAIAGADVSPAPKHRPKPEGRTHATK
jgi:hypothetical protein